MPLLIAISSNLGLKRTIVSCVAGYMDRYDIVILSKKKKVNDFIIIFKWYIREDVSKDLGIEEAIDKNYTAFYSVIQFNFR